MKKAAIRWVSLTTLPAAIATVLLVAGVLPREWLIPGGADMVMLAGWALSLVWERMHRLPPI